ncbi:MAG: protoporphyrinogen oxidase [Candidatus Acidiferrum sp.]
MGYTEKVVVIGAGISGLACAYRLKQLGLRPFVFEASERPGGLIATIRRNGFMFETGPQFPRFPASLWRLVQDLNLKGEFVAGDPKAKRYILRDGRLHPAPFSPMGLIRTRLVGLWSKLRILAEPFCYSQPPNQEETLRDFVTRKFDTDILDNLVDPFISTIFLGDALKMGMESAFPALVKWERHSGSLLRGAVSARKSQQGRSKPASFSPQAGASRGSWSAPNSQGKSLHVTDALPALGSFKSGMAALPEKLSGELRGVIKYRARITSLARLRSENGASPSGWQVTLAGGEQIEAEHLILAVPSHVAASLLEIGAPELASQLKAIEYAQICAVSSAYERSQVTNSLDGFGFMVPRCEGLHTICTFWNSSLFPERAREGTALITSFAGREGDEALSEMTDEAYAQTVEGENARILGIAGEPVDRVVWKDPYALPQYNVGHVRRVSEISRILRTLPNLHLVGNFLSGRSIGDCIDVASRVAEDLHSQLRPEGI